MALLVNELVCKEMVMDETAVEMLVQMLELAQELDVSRRTVAHLLDVVAIEVRDRLASCDESCAKCVGVIAKEVKYLVFEKDITEDEQKFIDAIKKSL